MPVIAYQLPQVIHLTYTGTYNNMINYPLTNSDFKIFLGLTNEVEFYLRDIDRKPVNLLDHVFTLYIFDKHTSKNIANYDLTVITPTKGLFKLIVNNPNLPLGTYSYVITKSVPDTGAEYPLFTNQYYSPQGTVSIEVGKVLPRPDPIIIDPNHFYWLDSMTFSGSYPGIKSLFTYLIDVTFDDFSGYFIIQYNNQQQPTANEQDWSDISNTLYTNQNGTIVVQYTGEFTWVRFKVITKSGRITKIIYPIYDSSY